MLTKTPNGVRFHIIDVYLEELMEVSQGNIDTDQFLLLLEPFLNLLQTSRDQALFDRIVKQIFHEFLNKYTTVSLSPSQDEDIENNDGKKLLLFQNVKIVAIQYTLFQIASDEQTNANSRPKIYTIHKEYAIHTGFPFVTEDIVHNMKSNLNHEDISHTQSTTTTKKNKKIKKSEILHDDHEDEEDDNDNNFNAKKKLKVTNKRNRDDEDNNNDSKLSNSVNNSVSKKNDDSHSNNNHSNNSNNITNSSNSKNNNSNDSISNKKKIKITQNDKSSTIPSTQSTPTTTPSTPLTNKKPTATATATHPVANNKTPVTPTATTTTTAVTTETTEFIASAKFQQYKLGYIFQKVNTL